MLTLIQSLATAGLLALGTGSAADLPTPAPASTAGPSAPKSARPVAPPTSNGVGNYEVLWWDCTPEYGGQAPDALREAMAVYVDAFGGGTVFSTTFVASEIPGDLAIHLASNSYDVIIFDATGGNTFDANDLAAVTAHYLNHPNLLLDGILYIRSIVFNSTTNFPGLNGSSGGFTVNEVWQLADRGGGVMIGTDHNCCQGAANAVLGTLVPGALFSGLTTPSLDGQFNGDDLLSAVATVSAFDLFTHWASVPSEAETPVGMFTDVHGRMVELFSQVDVADFVGGPRRPYISTSWAPGGVGPEFDCNNNGILDSDDIANGTSEDLNGNFVPDECEVVGSTYCPSLPNSTGVGAGLLATGSDVAADEQLTLTGYDMPVAETCLFICSPNQGLVMNPGNNMGNLCVVRTEFARFKQNILTTDANGRAVLEVDPWVVLTTPPQPILAGQTWNFQAWYRDGATSNFTDAVEIAFQ